MRILHFSDVHINVLDKNATSKLINKMIDCITQSYGDAPQIDLVVFSGDLIERGGVDSDGKRIFSVADGFTAFKDIVINPICIALNLPIEHFILTIGNHDIDWEQASDNIKLKIKEIKSEAEIYDIYHNYIERNNAPWVKDFNEFRDSLYCNANYPCNMGYSNIILILNSQKIGISILNSAWGSLPATKTVYLSKDQILESSEYLDEQKCDFKICVMHNPYYTLGEDENSEIRRLLSQHYNVCFTGHTHQQDSYGIVDTNDVCFISTAPKFRSLSTDIAEHDNRYLDGFVIFESVDDKYSITKYHLNNDRKFELDHNYGINGTKTINRLRPRLLQKISALYALEKELQVTTFPFIKNSALENIMKRLASDGEQFIRLTALSGFGKTRMLYEAFASQKSKFLSSNTNAYYCESSTNEADILTEIKSIIQSNPNSEGLIILDNCDVTIMGRVIDYMVHVNTTIRLIAVDNNPYDHTDIQSCMPIIISPDIIREQVNEYIDQKLSMPHFREIKEDVKMIADGYPYMAYRLIDLCLTGSTVSISSVNDIVKRMLCVKGVSESDDYQRVLQAIALFLPMPTKTGNKDAYNYIVNSTLITHLSSQDTLYRNDLFHRVIRRYNQTIIEQTDDWLRVRPFPLAIWLIQEWFEVMCDESLLTQLANEIKQQPEHVSKLLSNSICKRIETMQDSIPAKSLIAKLVEPGSGSFCSEKVVCSEMGSRLFLAMATVNPEKVANCLKYIFRNKTTDWIRNNIKDDIRRNLVYTLNKLCFANESFDDAVLVMAQFAKAENEHWSNNSKNGLTQLFPVFLPDTEVNLEKRAKTIELLWEKGYKDFALSAINVAFKNGNFSRMCGAEKFGWHHRESYTPETWNEVFSYWKRCKELLLSWYEKDDSIINDVRDLIEKHVHDWRSATLMNEYLFPLIDIIAPKSNWQWNKMYEQLIQLLRFHKSEYTQEQKNKINRYIEKLKPTLFADNLVYTGRKIFDNDTNKRSYEEVAHELIQPLALQFIKDKIYDNIDEVRALTTMQSGDGFFIKELTSLLSDKELTALLNNVKQIAEPKKDDFSSSFVNGILRAFSQSPVVQKYINDLFDNSLKKAFSRAMAVIENDNMDSFYRLLSLYNSGQIYYEHIVAYMSSLWGLTTEQMQILLPSLIEQFPDKMTDILEFVMKYRYWTKVLDDELLHKYVRRLLIDCPLLDEQKRVNHEQVEVIKEYLIKYKNTDIDFGIQINKKIIEVLGDSIIHDDILSDLYSELLQEPYQQAILDDFMDALTNNILFYMQVQHEIGSGFSFGAGPLFQYVSNEKLKYYCEKNVKIRHMLANMAPVFTSKDNNPRAEFSGFIQWLIEKYGNDDKSGVLSGISANMGTMSWTGTPIPLYEDMIHILTPYTNHPYMAVQKWALQEIDQLNQSITREKSRDDFMRMHYA